LLFFSAAEFSSSTTPQQRRGHDVRGPACAHPSPPRHPERFTRRRTRRREKRHAPPKNRGALAPLGQPPHFFATAISTTEQDTAPCSPRLDALGQNRRAAQVSAKAVARRANKATDTLCTPCASNWAARSTAHENVAA